MWPSGGPEGAREAAIRDGLALRLDRLTKRFGPLVAVDGLSIEVRQGEIYGLIGPNGSGKTTTVKMLVGLYRPTSGRVEVLGVDLTREPERAKRVLGYVPDEPFVYDKLSGREFLHLVGELYGIPRAARGARIERLLGIFQITEVIDGYMERYSRGNKQKLTILASLLHEPGVLVIDEPIVGLDPESAIRTRQLLLGFARAGGAVLLSTHTLAFAESVCHRVGLLKAGRLVQEGDLESLRRLAGLPGASLEALYLHFARG